MMDINQLIIDLQEISQKNSISHYKRDRCADAATALSTLQDENEKLRETVDKYATAARVIALHLKPFCDESLPYDEMIADAARKASDDLEQVTAERDAVVEKIREWEKFDTYLFVHNFITPEKWRGIKED